MIRIWGWRCLEGVKFRQVPVFKVNWDIGDRSLGFTYANGDLCHWPSDLL